MALYGSAFYQRVHGLSERRANIWLGVLLALGGLVGIALGTWFADVLAKRTQRAYLLWATIAVAGAIPAGIFGLLSPGYTQSFYFLFVCSVLLSSVLGPCNTVTANVVPAAERATGYALSIFLLHVFGDISSQLMVGHLSDWLAHASTFGSPVARLFESVGALPISGTNLRGGLLALVPHWALDRLFRFGLAVLGSRPRSSPLGFGRSGCRRAGVRSLGWLESKHVGLLWFTCQLGLWRSRPLARRPEGRRRPRRSRRFAVQERQVSG